MQSKDVQAQSSYKLFAITHQKGIPWNIKFHTHFHYEVFVFHSGDCNYLIDNNIYRLVPGDIIVMDGSKLHKPSLVGDPTQYDRSIVQFSIDWIRPVLQILDCAYLVEPFETNHYTLYRTNNKGVDELVHLLRSMEHLLNLQKFPDEEKRLKIKLIDLLFSIEAFRETMITEFEEVLDEKSYYIQQITTYVQDNYNGKILLEDIANEVNLSKSYLVHLFKEKTGYTIMDYVMQYRLTQSLHLLKTYPDWTFKQLSSSCGFESEAHYSRFFKKHIGVSPNVYRKEMKR